MKNPRPNSMNTGACGEGDHRSAGSKESDVVIRRPEWLGTARSIVGDHDDSTVLDLRKMHAFPREIHARFLMVELYEDEGDLALILSAQKQPNIRNLGEGFRFGRSNEEDQVILREYFSQTKNTLISFFVTVTRTGEVTELVRLSEEELHEGCHKTSFEAFDFENGQWTFNGINLEEADFWKLEQILDEIDDVMRIGSAPIAKPVPLLPPLTRGR